MSEMDLGKCEDLTGRVFGRLTVTGFAGRSKGRQILWDCRCSCGNEVSAKQGGHLKSGHTTSCGCYSREKIVEAQTTHGLASVPEYFVWSSMVGRCSNSSNARWHRYGGRGITVCPEWKSFEGFYADMGPRPSPVHSVERRDNDSGYSKDNCFWATPKEQANNKSNNRLLTHLGETKTMTEWCETLGLSYGAVCHRKQRGWADEDALTKPIRGRTPPKQPTNPAN